MVLNIACLTGVTNRWFEEDWQAGVKRQRTVRRDESFCLAMLKNEGRGLCGVHLPETRRPGTV